MSVIMWGVVGFLVGIVVIPALIWLWWWNTSFIHKATIFKQSGKDVSDVIQFEDKFKVIDRNGVHLIVFKRQQGKSPSFPGSSWLKWMRHKTIKITDENEWSVMRKHLSRGAMFYQTTEGEYHPVGFVKNDKGLAELKVLTQDNRLFLVSTYQEINDLTWTTRKQLIALAVIIGAIILLGVCFVLFLVYLTEASSNASAVASPSFIETASNVVVGG